MLEDYAFNEREQIKNDMAEKALAFSLIFCLCSSDHLYLFLLAKHHL